MKNEKTKTFKDLKFKPHSIGNGVIARLLFDNKYGVSVVRFNGSYGGHKGLYELAVLFGDELCYTTKITNDVIGWLTPRKVSAIMKRVQNLK